MDVVMQRDNERRRVVVDGRRTDDGARCTVVILHECSGHWAIYPHGDGALGVRMPGPGARTVARVILEDDWSSLPAASDPPASP